MKDFVIEILLLAAKILFGFLLAIICLSGLTIFAISMIEGHIFLGLIMLIFTPLMAAIIYKVFEYLNYLS